MCNAGEVKIIVYDLMGREVQTLVNERLQAGMYEVRFDGSKLTSGVYFYQFKSGDYRETKKMLLIK
jgi:5-hydroxyisourate hydrolase-like protein (transthyretin family)